MPGSTRSPAYRIVQSFVGLALLVMALTMLWLGMRAVMEIGGSCSSGGPYVNARPCPNVVVPMLLSFPLGFLGLLLYMAGSSRLPGPRLGLLSWSALFLSLGYNFWDFGLNPPGQPGVEWGWIVCGLIFTLMGGLPLLGLLDRDVAKAVLWADAPAPGQQPGMPRPKQAVPRRSALVRVVGEMHGVRAPESGGDEPAVVRPDQVVDEWAREALEVAAALERVAQLHRDGTLDDAEFQAAKDAILRRDR